MVDKQKELKPCPFCGGLPVIKERATRIVECKNCGTLQITRLEDEFATKWNARAEIDALKAENAKMRVLLTRWKIYGEAMMKSGSQLPRHLIADSEEALAQKED